MKITDRSTGQSTGLHQTIKPTYSIQSNNDCKMQRIGWFDAFRENGDPTWFGDNRTPVIFDLQIVILTSIFITPLLAFLIILPGVRHYRIASTIAFILSITVGAIVLSPLELMRFLNMINILRHSYSSIEILF
ncbi:hypothetical protein LOAG_12768 [Loa loa]|uniref:Uncharacterized protein n=1 Tax=Loa loa TaxID=7209 RepID=A0A1S0TL37_LOALO|nr:hypothetical protein LOAG_12768 [Loa loa]EFO15742.1 hypothetical protein LOAG_12768 [Loa loa]